MSTRYDMTRFALDRSTQAQNAVREANRFECLPISAATKCLSIEKELFSDEFPDRAQEVRTIYVAVCIHCYSLGQARAGCVGIRAWIWNEGSDRAIFGIPYANASLRARIKSITGLRQRELTRVGSAIPRLRVGDVDHIVAIDVHSAWPAELEPLSDELTVLIKNLDPVVLAIADEDPSSRIDCDRMRVIELAWPHTFSSPKFDELSGFVEFHDAGVPCCRCTTAVSVGDIDVSTWGNGNLGRLIERIDVRSSHACLAERHQEFPV